MDRQFAVAVVGATGLVGEMMIRVLAERGFPVSQLFPLASNRSLGHSVSFRGRSCAVNERRLRLRAVRFRPVLRGRGRLARARAARRSRRLHRHR